MSLQDLTERGSHFVERLKRRLRGEDGGGSISLAQRSEQGAQGERLAQRPCATPRVDIFEGKGELTIVADVPGARRETIDVSWDGGDELALYAHLDAPDGPFEADWYRAFTLPAGYDGAKAKARVSKGVLTIEIPTSAAVQPKRIAVRAGGRAR